jgi:hypothetical protein
MFQVTCEGTAAGSDDEEYSEDGVSFKGTEAQRHRGTEAQRRRGAEAQRRRGAEAQRRRGAEAQRRRGAEAQRRRGAEAQSKRRSLPSHGLMDCCKSKSYAKIHI